MFFVRAREVDEGEKEGGKDELARRKAQGVWALVVCACPLTGSRQPRPVYGQDIYRHRTAQINRICASRCFPSVLCRWGSTQDLQHVRGGGGNARCKPGKSKRQGSETGWEFGVNFLDVWWFRQMDTPPKE